MTLTQLLVVGAGGALGAIARYVLATLINAGSQSTFPFGTLLVNLSGALVIGLLAGVFEKLALPTDLRLFLLTGILGGYTTFSSFGLETVRLTESGAGGLAALYIAATNAVGLALVAVGWAISREVMDAAWRVFANKL